jgi:hypothetical protein
VQVSVSIYIGKCTVLPVKSVKNKAYKLPYKRAMAGKAKSALFEEK